MGASTAGRFGVRLHWQQACMIGCMCLAVVSCDSSHTFAPVTDVNAYEAVIKSGAAKPYAGNPAHAVASSHQLDDAIVKEWSWPASGTLLAAYSSKNKGIDIGGRLGDPIYATASGRVVYAGDGLRGYGNLIIIKHNSQYLSAYAYNRRLSAHAGEWVKKGQKIAEMGRASSGQVMLHFEIRRASLPVNPLNILTY